MPTRPVPVAIAEVYDEIRSEVTWMHGRWIVYRQLFAESSKRIDLLNEAAGVFFFIVQDVLLDEVQLTLSKLTDSARTMGHDNLSLEQLQSRLQIHGDAALADSCRRVLDKLLVQCQVFRTRRHKRLAHFDLSVALKASSAPPLPDVSRQMIEDALDSLRKYLNAIEVHYNDNTWGYEHFIMRGGDGDALVHVLRDGLRYEELVRAETIAYDDFQHGKWSDA